MLPVGAEQNLVTSEPQRRSCIYYGHELRWMAQSVLLTVLTVE